MITQFTEESITWSRQALKDLQQVHFHHPSKPSWVCPAAAGRGRFPLLAAHSCSLPSVSTSVCADLQPYGSGSCSRWQLITLQGGFYFLSGWSAGRLSWQPICMGTSRGREMLWPGRDGSTHSLAEGEWIDIRSLLILLTIELGLGFFGDVIYLGIFCSQMVNVVIFSLKSHHPKNLLQNNTHIIA